MPNCQSEKSHETQGNKTNLLMNSKWEMRDMSENIKCDQHPDDLLYYIVRLSVC